VNLRVVLERVIMKGLERLAVIRKQSENKDYNWIHRDIFRLLKKDDLWLTAYETRKKRIKIGMFTLLE